MQLPTHATIDEACEWLNSQTNQKWTLPRLLEDGHLRPYIWIDYVEGHPQIFGGRREGYLTEMVFHGDVVRLATDRDEAVFTWLTSHDGNPIQTSPWRVELKHIRFKRHQLERVAEIVNASTQPQPQSTPEPEDTPWHLLATPSELIAAFGTFTDMDKAWFNNAKDTPKLMAALHTAGQGGRKGREPLYFVFPVMQWLIDAKRRKGKPMTESTGWRVLKNQFPKIYEDYQGHEPDAN